MGLVQPKLQEPKWNNRIWLWHGTGELKGSQAELADFAHVKGAATIIATKWNASMKGKKNSKKRGLV